MSWPDSWGPRLDYILINAVRALLDVPGGTLLMLPRLLIDERFRVQLINQHVSDPVVRSFWLNQYAAYSDSFRTEAISPIENKIGRVLIEPRLRNMLARPKSTITLRRLMDEGAIVICNLSKGGLGESTAHLLGALLTTAFAQAALSRADTPGADRPVFHLYADEFQSFATESFGIILSEARKYGLTLTVAHQYLDQLPDDLRAAVFGNVGSIIACRVGATVSAPRCEPIVSGACGLIFQRHGVRPIPRRFADWSVCAVAWPRFCLAGPAMTGNKFRARADECVKAAGATAEPERKLALLDLAQRWRRLAVQLDQMHAQTRCDAPLVPELSAYKAA